MPDSPATFRTAHNEAFLELGARRPGLQWSAFDTTLEDARAGKATRLVTAIWNFHSTKDTSGRRVPNVPGLARNTANGELWYRTWKPTAENSSPTRDAHWDRLVLAFDRNVPVVGVLKDVRTRKCSLDHVFDCKNRRMQRDGSAMWFQVNPRGEVGCETTPIDIFAETVTWPDSAVAKTVESAGEGIPDGITRDHILEAIQEFDSGVAHRFAPSIRYDLVFDGKRYPPKAILGLAATRRANTEFGPEDFKGGEGSKCFRVLRELGFVVEQKPDAPIFPEQVDDEPHFEGAVSTVTVNRYERDPGARRKCIAHYGAKCQVCGISFGKRYGEIGEGFIHVHHLVPLSEIRKGYQVDPVRDLRPVCPNCHAMLHRRTPVPFGVEELKAIFCRSDAE